jgi:hypothetical protein
MGDYQFFLMLTIVTQIGLTIKRRRSLDRSPASSPARFVSGPSPSTIAQYRDNAESKARLALAATRLVEDDVDAALALFAEIHPPDPTYRDGIGRRGLVAAIDHDEGQDPRLAGYRHLHLWPLRASILVP